MIEYEPQAEELPRSAGDALPRKPESSDLLMMLTAITLASLAGVMWWMNGIGMVAAVVAPIVALLFLIHLPAVLFAYSFLQATDPIFVFNEYFTFGKGIGVMLVLLSVVHLRSLSRSGWPDHSLRMVQWSVAFFVASLLSAAWSVDPQKSLIAAAQVLIQIVLVVIVIAAVCAHASTAPRMLLWVAAGAATASVYLFAFGMDQTAFGRATLSEDTNPNTAALGLTICFGCLPLLWTMWRSSTIRAGAVLAGGLTLAGLIYTGSRAALVASLIALPIALLLAHPRNILKKVVLAMSLFGGIYIGGVAILEFAELGEKTEARLASILGRDSASTSSVEGSRWDVWRLHIDNWLSTGGLGTGIGASSAANVRRNGFPRDVHSSVLGSLVEMGPLGIISLAGLLTATWTCIWRVSNHGWRVALLTLFISMSLFMLTHTTYTTKWFWFPLSMIAAVSELDGRMRRASTGVASHAPGRDEI